MPQELMSEAYTVTSALNQPRHIRRYESVVPDAHDA